MLATPSTALSTVPGASKAHPPWQGTCSTTRTTLTVNKQKTKHLQLLCRSPWLTRDAAGMAGPMCMHTGRPQLYGTRRGGDWRVSPVLLKAWQHLQLPSCATARGHAIVKTALSPFQPHAIRLASACAALPQQLQASTAACCSMAHNMGSGSGGGEPRCTCKKSMWLWHHCGRACKDFAVSAFANNTLQTQV